MTRMQAETKAASRNADRRQKAYGYTYAAEKDKRGWHVVTFEHGLAIAREY